jgi:hypothetical protein
MLMKKKVGELKKGEKIKIGPKWFTVSGIELSEIGKQGVRKCRIEAKSDAGEAIVLIRPEDYPIEVG